MGGSNEVPPYPSIFLLFFLYWDKANGGSLTLNELLHSLGQHPIPHGLNICGWPRGLGWWLLAMAILDQGDDEFLGGFGGLYTNGNTEG